MPTAPHPTPLPGGYRLVPTILRLRLVPQTDTFLRLEHAPAQGWFLALAARLDADWARALHQGSDARPYALSPLCRADAAPLSEDDTIGGRALNCGRLRAHSPVSLRIGLSDDERANALCGYLDRHPDDLPPLGGTPCGLARIPAPVPDDPDRLFADWETLAEAPPARRLQVTFATPTAFSSQGNLVLLPEPACLLASWRRSWERFAPALPPGADAVSADRLRVARYALRTEPLRLKQGLFIGFVGTMELAWDRDTPPAARKAATALAGIAGFLGMGTKTAQGMGQTRVRVADDGA